MCVTLVIYQEWKYLFEKMNILGPEEKEVTEAWKNYTIGASLFLYLLYYYGNQTGEDEMDRVCGTHEIEKGMRTVHWW